MNGKDWIELILFLIILISLTKPLGLYLCCVLDPTQRTILDFLFKPLERGIYRFCRIDPLREQDWREYLIAIMAFSFISMLFVIVLLAGQFYFPLNPEQFAAPSWHLNLNTSISYMTNTNWQSYSGESTLSYFSQMAALAVQNFVSPAVGLATAAAIVRGLSRKAATTIGNFWADLVRLSLYLLLPLAFIIALLFLFEGVPQNFNAYVKAQTIEGRMQVIAQGPIASQKSIVLLGSGGGGFTNASSAHPYENPSPLSDALQRLFILLIPAAQLYYFGRMVKNTGHGWYLFAGMTILLIIGVWICSSFEKASSPTLTQLGIVGGNWEGKEMRFGLFDSSLFSCITTAVSCGAVNCCLGSLTPIGGLVPMLNMQLGEVVFGGVGTGLYGILIYVLFAIFVAGLVIGRTPEYLGNKIDHFQVKMKMIAFLSFVLVCHLFTVWACSSSWGVAGIGNTGPHGFSEMLYAYSSCAANNGSLFEGLSTNTPAYNLTLAFAMLFGRFSILAVVMALAGSLVEKQIHPRSETSIPIASLIFTSLVIGSVLIIGALTFLPAVTMGPILEQISLVKGVLFP